MHVVARMPRHGIVHLATHGIAFAEHLLKSFIALGVPDAQELVCFRERQQQALLAWPEVKQFLGFDVSPAQLGLLTAEEILYLPLPADLVTLSACQTGLGRISGDGMIGLSRSFLVAGARAVLVSLWSVSDAATAELMAQFYRAYRDLDDTIALQRAMAAVRGKSEYAHPHYWAPFLVVDAEA